MLQEYKENKMNYYPISYEGKWNTTGIKGDELLPSWEPPPVVVIVCDIRDSELHDRIRVLYSYSYLRGSYEIEADLTTQ
jgi:hypothetical protein